MRLNSTRGSSGSYNISPSDRASENSLRNWGCLFQPIIMKIYPASEYNFNSVMEIVWVPCRRIPNGFPLRENVRCQMDIRVFELRANDRISDSCRCRAPSQPRRTRLEDWYRSFLTTEKLAGELKLNTHALNMAPANAHLPQTLHFSLHKRMYS